MGLMKAPNPQTGNWEGVDASALNDGNGERITVSRIKDTESQLTTVSSQLAETVMQQKWANVKKYGAKGDGIADDSKAIQNAINDNSNVYIPKGTYLLKNSLNIKKPTNISGDGVDTLLLSTSLHPNNRIFFIASDLENQYLVTETAIAKNTKTLTLQTSGLSVGDTVYMLLGTDPYDPNEEYYRGFNKITGIVDNIVTLEIAISEDIPTGARTNKLYKFKNNMIAENVNIENVTLDFKDVTIDQLIWYRWSRHSTLKNIFVKKCPSVFDCTESEFMNFSGIEVDRTYMVHGSAHTFNFWGTKHAKLQNVKIKNAVNINPVSCESVNNFIEFDNIEINCNNTSNQTMFSIGGRSRNLVAKNVTINSNFPIQFQSVVQESKLSCENISLLCDVKSFDYRNTRTFLLKEGYFEDKDLQKYRLEKTLTRSMNPFSFTLPKGLYKRIRIWTNAENLAITGIHLSNLDNVGGINATGKNVKNTMIDLTGVGFYGNDYVFNNYLPKKLEIYTSSAILGTERFVLEIDYYNNESTQTQFGYFFTSTNSGMLTYSGDGTTVTKSIAHGLLSTPKFFQVTPSSIDAGTAGIKFVTADETNLIVTFNIAPIIGTNNVKLTWKAEI